MHGDASEAPASPTFRNPSHLRRGAALRQRLVGRLPVRHHQQQIQTPTIQHAAQRLDSRPTPLLVQRCFCTNPDRGAPSWQLRLRPDTPSAADASGGSAPNGRFAFSQIPTHHVLVLYRLCARGLPLSRAAALPPGLLPRARGLCPRAYPATDCHHAAAARQERRRHDAPAGLPAGARPRPAGGDRLLLGDAGLEVQPPRAAHPRIAGIRGLFSGHLHQAGGETARLHPHGRRGGNHRPPRRSALGRARGLAHGQPRRLLHPRRPLQGCHRGQLAPHPRQLLGVVHLGGPHPHAQRLARAGCLHPLARGGPHRLAHAP